MFKTVIFATDGSLAAERVLLYAEHVARVEEAHVFVVHAYQLPQVYEWAEGYQELVEDYRRVAREAAQDAVRVLERAGIQATPDVREGPPAQVTLAAAQEHNADLIVMGSRAEKRENVAELLLGSVSTTVLRFAPCPVLIVP